MKKHDLEQKDRKEDASALTERTAGKAMTAPAEMETLEAMPLLEHLQALRKVLLASMAAILIGFLLVFFLWSSRLVQWVTEPLEREGIQLIYTEVAEAFSAQTRMSLIAGTVLGSPVVFASIWWFVRPALHRRERRAALVYLSAALILFILGVMFAYRFVFFLAVNFFVTMGDNMATPMFSLSGSLRDHVRAAGSGGLAFETGPGDGAAAGPGKEIYNSGSFYCGGGSHTAGCRLPVHAGSSASGIV